MLGRSLGSGPRILYAYPRWELPLPSVEDFPGVPHRAKPGYSFSKNSQAEQEMKTPPGILRSRSFTRFTIRVGLPHLGQSVLFVVSITFLRSAVLAIFAGMVLLQFRGTNPASSPESRLIR